MNIVSKTSTERLVRDIDVTYIGGDRESLTLFDGDKFEILKSEIRVTLTTEGRSGIVHLLFANMLWWSERTRVMEQPLPPDTTPPAPLTS